VKYELKIKKLKGLICFSKLSPLKGLNLKMIFTKFQGHPAQTRLHKVCNSTISNKANPKKPPIRHPISRKWTPLHKFGKYLASF